MNEAVRITEECLANNADLRRRAEDFVRTAMAGRFRTYPPFKIDGERITARELHNRVDKLDDEALAELCELLMEKLGV